MSILIDIGGRGAVPWQPFRSFAFTFAAVLPGHMVLRQGAFGAHAKLQCDIFPYPVFGFNNGGH